MFYLSNQLYTNKIIAWIVAGQLNQKCGGKEASKTYKVDALERHIEEPISTDVMMVNLLTSVMLLVF